MTDRSSSKLQRLLASVAVIAAFYALFFLIDGSFSAYWYGLGLDKVRGHMGARNLDFLFIAGTFAVPILWWHAFDFICKHIPDSALFRTLLSYRIAVSLLVLGLLGATVIFAGVVEVIECWRPESKPTASGNTFGFTCTPTGGGGMIPLIILPVFCLLVLAVVKTLWAVSNLFKRKI